MNALECIAVAKSFASVAALDGADLDVVTGHLTALLGPSGCGKSTLLRVIAGFERLDAGSVSVSGRPVAGPGLHLPPESRKAGIVPQEQALFPHLSVAANVGYGLDREGRRSGRVESLLEVCGLGGLGTRMPHELSGGQQQRVALARALAPEPAVVLLDEPFANLDATLRGELRAEIAAILRAAGQTALLVTHDQDEALSMADTVAVMRAGRIVQHGGPDEIYTQPADAWVAGFVGLANVLRGDVTEIGEVVTALGTTTVAGQPVVRGKADVVIRPEQLVLGGGGAGGGAGGGVGGVVLRREYHGHDALVWIELADGTPVVARIATGALPATGSQVSVACTSAVLVFPRASGSAR